MRLAFRARWQAALVILLFLGSLAALAVSSAMAFFLPSEELRVREQVGAAAARLARDGARRWKNPGLPGQARRLAFCNGSERSPKRTCRRRAPRKAAITSAATSINSPTAARPAVPARLLPATIGRRRPGKTTGRRRGMIDRRRPTMKGLGRRPESPPTSASRLGIACPGRPNRGRSSRRWTSARAASWSARPRSATNGRPAPPPGRWFASTGRSSSRPGSCAPRSPPALPSPGFCWRWC